MKKNSFTEMFYRNAGYFGVALISLVYVASGLVSISKTGKSLWEILATGTLSLIVGIMINGIFRSIGIRRGDEDERTQSTAALHSRAVDEITPYIDRLDSFCREENERALKDIRSRILAREGLKYTDFFDGEGAILKDSSPPLEKQKRKVYYKALRVKIKPLSPSHLTTDGSRADNPFDFGKSKREYTSGKGAGDILIKLLMAVIFGYFGVTLTGYVDTATIIWNSLQIVLYITGGVIQMYSSYMWVLDDYRFGIIKKIDYLQKFKAYASRE